MLIELDTENADRDLTSSVTVLTDTPNASSPMMCQGLIMLGDGSKDLSGTGGDFEFVITVNGQTVQPSPQVVNFSTDIRASVWTGAFPVPANVEVVIKVKSPNAADSDVDVTAYLYDLMPVGDASGRVDLGEWLGTAVTVSATTAKPQVDVDSINNSAEAADSLQIAAARLGNKVTRNVSTGTMSVYDFAGTSVIYTVTWADDGTTETRGKAT